MRRHPVRHGLTRADAIVIAAVCLAIVASAGAASMIASTGSLAVVEVDGISVLTVRLDTDAQAPVRGAKGELTVEVREGRVAVVRADCPNQVCVRTGWRSHEGDAIVCVPNKTIVRIQGQRSKGIHGITG